MWWVTVRDFRLGWVLVCGDGTVGLGPSAFPCFRIPPLPCRTTDLVREATGDR